MNCAHTRAHIGERCVPSVPAYQQTIFLRSFREIEVVRRAVRCWYAVGLRREPIKYPRIFGAPARSGQTRTLWSYEAPAPRPPAPKPINKPGDTLAAGIAGPTLPVAPTSERAATPGAACGVEIAALIVPVALTGEGSGDAETRFIRAGEGEDKPLGPALIGSTDEGTDSERRAAAVVNPVASADRGCKTLGIPRCSAGCGTGLTDRFAARLTTTGALSPTRRTNGAAGAAPAEGLHHRDRRGVGPVFGRRPPRLPLSVSFWLDLGVFGSERGKNEPRQQGLG
jgi:hypothetical protein